MISVQGNLENVSELWQKDGYGSETVVDRGMWNSRFLLRVLLSTWYFVFVSLLCLLLFMSCIHTPFSEPFYFYCQTHITHFSTLGHHKNLHTPPFRPFTFHPHLNTNKPLLVQRRLYPIPRHLLPPKPLPHTPTPKHRQAKTSHRRDNKLWRQSARCTLKSRIEGEWITIQCLPRKNGRGKQQERRKGISWYRFLHHVLWCRGRETAARDL